MTAIPKNTPTSEIHMVTQVQSISRCFSMEVSFGKLHHHFHARSADQKIGIDELGLDCEEQMPGHHTSDYTRLGLPWGANLTDFTGTESFGSLET